MIIPYTSDIFNHPFLLCVQARSSLGAVILIMEVPMMNVRAHTSVRVK